MFPAHKVRSACFEVTPEPPIRVTSPLQTTTLSLFALQARTAAPLPRLTSIPTLMTALQDITQSRV